MTGDSLGIRVNRTEGETNRRWLPSLRVRRNTTFRLRLKTFLFAPFLPGALEARHPLDAIGAAGAFFVSAVLHFIAGARMEERAQWDILGFRSVSFSLKEVESGGSRIKPQARLPYDK